MKRAQKLTTRRLRERKAELEDLDLDPDPTAGCFIVGRRLYKRDGAGNIYRYYPPQPTTATIAAKIHPVKKELVDLLLRKADLTADNIIDVALSQWIRANLDLLSDDERKQYHPYLINA